MLFVTYIVHMFAMYGIIAARPNVHKIHRPFRLLGSTWVSCASTSNEATTFKNALRSDDWLNGLLADRVLKISIKIAPLQEEWYIS